MRALRLTRDSLGDRLLGRLFSLATVFDLVFPRLLTGERVGAAELAELGHGGFLTRDMAYRFPPNRGENRRGEVPDVDG